MCPHGSWSVWHHHMIKNLHSCSTPLLLLPPPPPLLPVCLRARQFFLPQSGMQVVERISAHSFSLFFSSFFFFSFFLGAHETMGASLLEAVWIETIFYWWEGENSVRKFIFYFLLILSWMSAGRTVLTSPAFLLIFVAKAVFFNILIKFFFVSFFEMHNPLNMQRE